jgi:hypothetical protein
MREWLIRKLIGNKPVIANVTINVKGPIKASEPVILFHKSSVVDTKGGTF